MTTKSEPPARRRERPRSSSTVNWPVFVTAAAIIIAITLWAGLDADGAEAIMGSVVSWVSINLGWYYFVITTVVLIFVLIVAFSRVGRTRLGPDHSRPQFNLFTWGAMLFAAGIGIDLMFFSVSEPVAQYLSPPQIEGSTPESARQALVWTLLHYGITGWALYALMGLALGYFAYRQNLPLSIRSALYPILGKRIEGWAGHSVDIAALIGTIFGIAVSLGIGVVQLNYGLSFMFNVPQSVTVQIALIVISVLMAVVSAVSGVEKGIRRLSELNVILAIALMLFILVTGKTAFLMNGIVQNIGDVISQFPALTMNTMAYDRPDEWMQAWTLFFWAWWIAWAPFVGLFLARISRGRTIRQFVIGVLTVPFLFIAVWISIFGNSALDLVIGGNAEFGDAAMNHPEEAFYGLLAQYPAVPLTVAIATFTGLLFYVTSADSGALVMANFTSKLRDPSDDGAPWLRIFWACATGALTLAMLLLGGVTALQNATIVMGLPLSIVLVLIMLGVYKALRVEDSYSQSFRASLPTILTGHTSAGESKTWRQRLGRAMTYPNRDQAQRFIDETARPALDAVSDELRARGARVRLDESVVEPCRIDQLDLRVTMPGERDFKYQVYPVEYGMPSYAMLSTARPDRYYRIEVFTLEGSNGYDVLGYTRDQLICDVIDNYERHLEFLHQNRESPGTTVITDSTSAQSDWSEDLHTSQLPVAAPDETDQTAKESR